MNTVSNLPPSCDIERYSILSLCARRCSDDTVAKIEIRPDVKVSDGNCRYSVRLECNRIDSGFSFSCLIEADFAFHEPISQKNVMHAWVNGCTILYGILRNIYSVNALQCVHKELMLPAVMMIDVVKNTIEAIKSKNLSSNNVH